MEDCECLIHPITQTPLQNRNTTLPRSIKTFISAVFFLSSSHYSFLLCTGPFFVPSFLRLCTILHDTFLSPFFSPLASFPFHRLRSASQSQSINLTHRRPDSCHPTQYFSNPTHLFSLAKILSCRRAMDSWRVAVLGDGGVGKTALAVQVGRFPCVLTHPLTALSSP
jgi:hypothetical protein